MIYLMLVVVFSELSKKWWLFMFIGYGEFFERLFRLIGFIESNNAINIEY